VKTKKKKNCKKENYAIKEKMWKIIISAINNDTINEK
jgi:hypothetical protein